ncbi:MAG: lysophospholipase [Acidimicrobiales bacterium]|nr:MAG: lysophospholipase [Acidimicrobiales bacterium]
MRRLLFSLLAGVLVLASCSGGGADRAGDGRGATGRGAGGDGEGSRPAADEETRDRAAEATPFSGYESKIYGDLDKWLCGPGPSVPCTENLDASVVEADGTVRVERHRVAEDPRFDCFYVYPTVNLGTEGNAAFDGDYGAELLAVRNQAARFSRLCRVYVPVYRQVTLGAFGSMRREGLGEKAYSDVLDAFKHYVANLSEGRGFLLIGHSQGSGHLRRLIREVVEPDENLRSRVVAAYLIGSTVEVPEGRDVGGDFGRFPACRSRDQFGCVVSYASYRSTSPPPQNAFFGRAGEGREALCVNPGAPGGGAAELTPYYPVETQRGFADEAQNAKITTPFVVLPGLVSAECVRKGGFSYLEITVRSDPNDPRVDDVEGDISPEWGLHAADVNLALGQLLDLAERQANRWLEESGS